MCFEFIVQTHTQPTNQTICMRQIESPLFSVYRASEWPRRVCVWYRVCSAYKRCDVIAVAQTSHISGAWCRQVLIYANHLLRVALYLFNISHALDLARCNGAISTNQSHVSNADEQMIRHTKLPLDPQYEHVSMCVHVLTNWLSAPASSLSKRLIYVWQSRAQNLQHTKLAQKPISIRWHANDMCGVCVCVSCFYRL